MTHSPLHPLPDNWNTDGFVFICFEAKASIADGIKFIHTPRIVTNNANTMPVTGYDCIIGGNSINSQFSIFEIRIPEPIQSSYDDDIIVEGFCLPENLEQVKTAVTSLLRGVITAKLEKLQASLDGWKTVLKPRPAFLIPDNDEFVSCAICWATTHKNAVTNWPETKRLFIEAHTESCKK